MDVDDLLEELERFNADMKRVPVGDIEEFGREGHPRRAVCRERARAVLLRRLKTQAAIGSRIGRREDFYER